MSRGALSVNFPETFMSCAGLEVDDYGGESGAVCRGSRQARPRSLRRLKAQLLRSGRESVALLLHRGCELSRSTGVGDLAGRAQFLSEIRLLHYNAYIGSDTLAKLHRHPLWAEKADQPVEREFRIAGFVNGRYLGVSWRSYAVGRRKHLDFSSLKLWTQRRQ